MLCVLITHTKNYNNNNAKRRWEETSGGDGYVSGPDGGDGFTSVYGSQTHQVVYVKYEQFSTCHIDLNKMAFKIII